MKKNHTLSGTINSETHEIIPDREEKIEREARKYVDQNSMGDTFRSIDIELTEGIVFKAEILAGIKLRDAELLAMEFDEGEAKYKALSTPFLDTTNTVNAGIKMARWQHEQFMKAIKGDGDVR